MPPRTASTLPGRTLTCGSRGEGVLKLAQAQAHRWHAADAGQDAGELRGHGGSWHAAERHASRPRNLSGVDPAMLAQAVGRRPCQLRPRRSDSQVRGDGRVVRWCLGGRMLLLRRLSVIWLWRAYHQSRCISGIQSLRQQACSLLV